MMDMRGLDAVYSQLASKVDNAWHGNFGGCRRSPFAAFGLYEFIRTWRDTTDNAWHGQSKIESGQKRINDFGTNGMRDNDA